jgi:alpha-glucosidase/oligosaccharide 4-alpha-D-glucosyltransferase
MRSQKDGINITSIERPHLWEEDHIDLWRRYAKLHTQLYPYIQAAAEEYYTTGMPIMRHHLLSDPDDPAAHGRDDQYRFGPDLLVAPVLVDGARERSLYLPEGRWIEWWGSVDYLESTGGFELADAQVHEGGSEVTVPAPIDEIPLFVRAGAVIPMLAPDVYTLAEHGDDPSIVHLSDRDDQLHLIAFPRGDSAGRFFDSGSYTSSAGESWSLTIDDPTPRTVWLQASFAAMDDPIEPCAVSVGGVELPLEDWSFDAGDGVVSVRYPSAAGLLEVTDCGA